MRPLQLSAFSDKPCNQKCTNLKRELIGARCPSPAKKPILAAAWQPPDRRAATARCHRVPSYTTCPCARLFGWRTQPRLGQALLWFPVAVVPSQAERVSAVVRAGPSDDRRFLAYLASRTHDGVSVLSDKSLTRKSSLSTATLHFFGDRRTLPTMRSSILVPLLPPSRLGAKAQGRQNRRHSTFRRPGRTIAARLHQLRSVMPHHWPHKKP